jgi:glutathione peroxidase
MDKVTMRTKMEMKSMSINSMLFVAGLAFMTSAMPISASAQVTANDQAQAETKSQVASEEKAPMDAVSLKSLAQCPEYLKVKARKLHSEKVIDLCELTQGKAVLIVNTASNCGFTPQFKALESLHQKYQAQGLVVIGFPSDDFFQEEKDEAKTADVCFLNYGVNFTMLATSAVRGRDVNSVFKHLEDKSTSPKWNFYKYLVSADGETVQQFNSKVKPDSIELTQAIDALLNKQQAATTKSIGINRNQ